jgi:hypothetical protein
MDFTKENITEKFKQHEIWRVVFTKANGDEREMTCTKMMHLIPEELHPKGSDPKPESETACNVYEMQVGWRSFRYDRIISIDPVTL